MVLLVIACALFAAFFVGTVLHELAHSLAAGLMGLGVSEVHFGGGPVLLRAGLGRTAIEFRLFPGQGLVQHMRPGGRFRRSRLFVFTAAGPACDIALLLALLAAIRQPHASDHLDLAMDIATGVQAYFAFSNLWPRTVEIEGRKIPNDGLQMLQILANRHPETIYPRGQPAVEHILYEGLIGRYLQPHEQALPRAERSPEILAYYVARHVDKRSVDQDMRAALDHALSNPRPVPEELLLLETLVTEVLGKADAKSLADLDRWSARAYEIGAGLATIRATRGSVLIETDHPAEGVALLEDGLTGEEYNDCMVHAFRALGYFKLRETALAEREFAASNALFDHERWQALDIMPIVERIAGTIGADFRSPATWSLEAARAAFKTQTSGPRSLPDRP